MIYDGDPSAIKKAVKVLDESDIDSFTYRVLRALHNRGIDIKKELFEYLKDARLSVYWLDVLNIAAQKYPDEAAPFLEKITEKDLENIHWSGDSVFRLGATIVLLNAGNKFDSCFRNETFRNMKFILGKASKSGPEQGTKLINEADKLFDRNFSIMLSNKVDVFNLFIRASWSCKSPDHLKWVTEGQDCVVAEHDSDLDMDTLVSNLATIGDFENAYYSWKKMTPSKRRHHASKLIIELARNKNYDGIFDLLQGLKYDDDRTFYTLNLLSWDILWKAPMSDSYYW